MQRKTQMNDLESQLQKFFDEMFLDFLAAYSRMTEQEKERSDKRAISYRRQWELFKDHQRDKYGLDGGPSPCVIVRDEFKPQGEF